MEKRLIKVLRILGSNPSSDIVSMNFLSIFFLPFSSLSIFHPKSQSEKTKTDSHLFTFLDPESIKIVKKNPRILALKK
jgi:hypothetical protein